MHGALNWINVMTYDYHGAWDGATGHNAPLAGGAPDLTTTIREYLALGVPREKLVLGFATYARSFGAVERAEPGAPSTQPGPDGPCGPESLTAAQAAEWVEKGRFVGYWDEVAAVPYAYSASERAWVSYDDARSYAAKLELLERERLGGAMFWAIDLDDVARGYPLIRQVSEALAARRGRASADESARFREAEALAAP
jgi:chitinase